MEIKFTPKNAILVCHLCHFTCCKNSDWERHVDTIKHQYRVNGNQMETAEITKNACYICNCGKKYLTNSGLWKHNKVCKQNDKNDTEEKQIKINDYEKDDIQINNLIIEMIKSNTELQKENNEFKQMLIDQNKQMIEMAKNAGNNTNIANNNNTTNSHNKAFNLQFFLNETCKDAMNIMDFVDSIKLQLSDLINVGELGYVEGISNIIVKNLKELDVEKRPVHCTDKKRETMYVKDDNKWEKDDENVRIIKAIKRVVTKNQRLLLKFKETYPDYKKYHSKYSDQYNKLLIEAMGGSGNNDLEKEEKIIRNISKSVVVEK